MLTTIASMCREMAVEEFNEELDAFLKQFWPLLEIFGSNTTLRPVCESTIVR